MALNNISEIIEDFRQGRIVILMDDEDRENEGDLLIAADRITAQDVNFMATHARGLICLTLTQERCRQLNLPLMVQCSAQPFGCAFSISRQWWKKRSRALVRQRLRICPPSWRMMARRGPKLG